MVSVEFTQLEIIASSVLSDFVKNKLDMFFKLFRFKREKIAMFKRNNESLPSMNNEVLSFFFEFVFVVAAWLFLLLLLLFGIFYFL